MKVSLLIAAILVTTTFADDRLRDAQEELKSQGFFYGEVDGKDGAESSAAIRRFQIRNGLQVTGKLTDETLAALGLGKNTETKPEPAPQKPQPAQVNPPPPSDTPPAKAPRATPASDPDAPRTKPHLPPEDPSIVPPPRPLPPATNDDYGALYRGTPYATAPREVQLDVLRKAQIQLGRRGFYKAAPDGHPGPATSEAISLYQIQRRLPRTGLLDLQTLSTLGLLPGRSSDAPPLKPFYDPARRHDRSVDYDSMRRL